MVSFPILSEFGRDSSDAPRRSTDMFKAALSTVDVTFQNLDSSEISISDVSHYYDSDPTKVVEGLRKDGKKPSSMMADTTTANAQVRSLSETVRLDARTKLLNPKFYEGMLASCYEGCLLYTSPSPRDQRGSRMPSSA